MPYLNIFISETIKTRGAWLQHWWHSFSQCLLLGGEAGGKVILLMVMMFTSGGISHGHTFLGASNEDPVDVRGGGRLSAVPWPAGCSAIGSALCWCSWSLIFCVFCKFLQFHCLLLRNHSNNCERWPVINCKCAVLMFHPSMENSR